MNYQPHFAPYYELRKKEKELVLSPHNLATIWMKRLPGDI